MEHHVVIGAGAVGTATALALADRGNAVTILTRSGSGPVHPAVKRCAGNAGDAGLVGEIAAGAAAIYNCANPKYHQWERDWPPIAEALLAAAEARGARLVTVSNLYAYGPVAQPMTPDLPLRPNGRKGAVRAAMWEAALAAHQAGRVEVCEARASDFFGPGCTDQSQLGSRVMPRLLAGRPVRFLGDPEALHSLTFVADVAATLVVLGSDDRAVGRAWHVPSSETSYAAGARVAAAIAGVDAPRIGTLAPWLLRLAGVFSPVVRELQEVRYQFERPFVIDARETTEVFGLEATPFAMAIRATVEWWQAQAGAARPSAPDEPQPKNSPPLTSSV
jgi:nucleoside-diphosphate-sugar epimerase